MVSACYLRPLPYAAQLQNVVVEVFGLPKLLAKAYGTRSMRCGGGTALLAIGITGSDRRDIGFWTSESSERRYLRTHAIGRARSLLAKGVTSL